MLVDALVASMVQGIGTDVLIAMEDGGLKASRVQTETEVIVRWSAAAPEQLEAIIHTAVCRRLKGEDESRALSLVD